MQGKVTTYFCSFSRPWLIKRWIKDFEHINREQDRSQIHLAFIVDIDCPQIWVSLRDMAHRGGYASCEIAMNRQNVPNEVSTAWRRKRIAAIKQQSKDIISRHDSDLVVGLEDDAVLGHLDNLNRLALPEGVSMVSGIQVGRWMLKYAGAWIFDDAHNPTIAETVMPIPSIQPQMPADAGYETVDAAGFYCYSTTRQLYLEHDYHWEEDQPWGPDVNYGLWLRRQGHQVLLDWRTPVGHNDHNNIIEVYDDKQFHKVCYTKNDDNSWRRM